MGPDDEVQTPHPLWEYEQLAGILKARLERGDWKKDHPIATELALMQEYGLARNTVRKAIDVLVDEELVYRVPRRGVFVR